MSVTDWFRRLFAGSPEGAAGESEPDNLAGAGGVSGYASLEVAEAIEDIDASTEDPRH